MKKLLAVLLVLCLFVGMMPMAFAEELVDTATTGEEATNNLPEESVDVKTEPETRPLPEENVQTTPTYVANNIKTLDELKAALAAKEPVITIVETINFTEEVKIDYNATIKGNGNVGFNGSKLLVGWGSAVRFESLNVSAIIEVGADATLTFSSDCTVDVGKVYGNGSNVVYEKQEEPENPDPILPPTEDPDPAPKQFTLTFEVYPYWASIALMDDQGQSVTVIGNKATVTEGVTYKYTVSADGFTTVTGEVKVTDDETVKVPLPQSTRVIIWPSSHGYVTYRINDKYNGDLVALFVNPDSGYYLDDLTVKMSGGATFTPYHHEGNVYYFRLYGEKATVYATFKALPDEYRVYIANTEHGTVSVDTRYAEEGEWVYITVNPNAGYRLSDLTVTRPSGNTVKVEHVRGNVFRFAMPGVRVTVDAEFVRTTMPFTDVSRGQWFYDAVSFVYWRDIMDGVTSTQFAPDATTTRAMVVQILYRMAGSPTVRGSSPFYDVSNGAWYADAVIWAEANDIVNGMTTTTFAPNTAVTREQLATMLYRYAQYRHYNTSAGANTNILSYYDANRISEYAFSALQWACGEGIMDGTGTGYLSPQGQATRAQLAAMLMRFCMEYRI